MLTDVGTLIGVILSFLVSFWLFIFIDKKKDKKQIQKVFMLLAVELAFWCLLLIVQITASIPLNINPLTIDNIVFIFSMTVPVLLLIMSLIFANTKIKFTYKYLALFIIPVISLIILWTNKYHNLFFVHYSVNINEVVYGKFFIVQSIYSYLCLFIAMYILIYYSIKNAGFFSKQSIMIVLGTIIPLTVNILGTFQIIPLSIYVTPITFLVAIAFYAFAILKFQFLNIAPIAAQKINDSISDGFMVLNEDMRIIDYNKTVQEVLNITNITLRNNEFLCLEDILKADNVNIYDFIKSIEKTKNNNTTVSLEVYFDKTDKYFNVEINSIFSKNSYIGTLILFKDITQHMKDLQEIKQSQEIIVRQEKFVTLRRISRTE